MKKLIFAVMIVPVLSFADYDRGEFGAWADEDRDCQNTRTEVLVEQSYIPVTLSKDGCSVILGLWVDPYTSKVVSDPKQLDVDHKVPLKEAYQSGAEKWNKSFKISFANDRENLIAVSKEANRSKGDKGPSEWMPANIAYWGVYLADWVYVKQKWHLSLEKDKESILLLQRVSAKNKKGMVFSEAAEIKDLAR